MSAAAFDPLELAGLADPHPRYDEIRADGPVVELATRGLGVFGYDAASFVLRDPRFCSAPLGRLYAATLPTGALADEMSHRINFLDPPDHPRVRVSWRRRSHPDGSARSAPGSRRRRRVWWMSWPWTTGRSRSCTGSRTGCRRW